MRGGGIFSSWKKPNPSVITNNLSGPENHTKICMYTPKYIKEIHNILSEYKLKNNTLHNLNILASYIISNMVITPYLDTTDHGFQEIDVSQKYTSLRQKMRDIKRLNTLVDKEIINKLNEASETMDMNQRFELTGKLEKLKKIHCTTHMKEVDDLTLKRMDYFDTLTYGGKRKTKNRRSKRKTRKLK